MGSNPATPTIYLIEIADRNLRPSADSVSLKREHKGSKRAHGNIESRQSPASCFFYVRVHAEMARTDSDSENFGGLTIAAAAARAGRNHFSDAFESSPPPGREISTSEVTCFVGLSPIDPRICAGGAKTPDVVANGQFLKAGESQPDVLIPAQLVLIGREYRCVEAYQCVRRRYRQAAASPVRSGGSPFSINGAAPK